MDATTADTISADDMTKLITLAKVRLSADLHMASGRGQNPHKMIWDHLLKDKRFAELESISRPLIPPLIQLMQEKDDELQKLQGENHRLSIDVSRLIEEVTKREENDRSGLEIERISEDWFSEIDPDILKEAVGEEMLTAYATGGGEAVAAIFLKKNFPDDPPMSPETFWKGVSQEFRILVCTNSPEYKDFRKQIRATLTVGKHQFTQSVMTSLAAYLGIYIGAPWLPMINIAGLLLYGSFTLGRNAYCKGSTPVAHQPP
jgi:hypothetical protein